MINISQSGFRLGQFVRPNRSLCKGWFDGRSDPDGAYFPLIDENGESSNARIRWGVEGIVIQVYDRDIMVVSFPEGLVLTRGSWITPSDAVEPCNPPTAVVG